jgi:hypothetical protein
MERISMRHALAATIALVVAAHYVVLFIDSGLDIDTHGLLAPFDLFEERSLGTWVSAAVLAGGSLAAAAAGRATPRDAVTLHRGWIALAGVIGLCSLDEVAGFHESTVDAVRAAAELPGALRYAAWVLPALVVVAVFIVWQWRFFRLLPRALSVRIAAAAGVYVAAAAGLEIGESALLSSSSGRDWTPVLQVLVGVEEGVEMGAAAVLLLALLHHVQALCPTWRLSLAGHGDQLSLSPAAVAAAAAPTQGAEAERFKRDVAAVRA